MADTAKSKRPFPASLFISIAEVLADMVFPKKCISCGGFLIQHKEVLPFTTAPDAHITSTPGTSLSEIASMEMAQAFDAIFNIRLCHDCKGGFAAIEPPLCSSCGTMFPYSAGGNHHCSDCILSPWKIGKARAAGLYTGSFGAAIRRYKYAERTSLAKPLSQILFRAYTQFWEVNEVDLILPVPLHTRRMRQRGFNQAWLIIQNWEEMFAALATETQTAEVKTPEAKTPEQKTPEVNPDILIRTRWTQPQVDLTKDERKKNIRNAFKVKHPGKIKGKKILLVDDVCTTGATVKECAKVLLKAGAINVDVITLARA